MSQIMYVPVLSFLIPNPNIGNTSTIFENKQKKTQKTPRFSKKKTQHAYHMPNDSMFSNAIHIY